MTTPEPVPSLDNDGSVGKRNMTRTSTPLDLDAVRRRAEAAEFSSQAIHQYESAADVPALLAEVERLRAMAEATAEHDARKAIAGRFVAGGWEKNSVCERYYPKCCSYHEGFDDALAEYGHMLRTNDLEAP